MPQETLGSPDEAPRPRLRDSHLRPGGFREGWRRGQRSAGCGRGTGPRRSHPGAGAHRTRWGGRGAPALRCAGTWLSRGASTSASDPGTPCWTRGCLWTGGVGTASDLHAAPSAGTRRQCVTETSGEQGLWDPTTRPLHLPTRLPLSSLFKNRLLICF